MMVSFVRPPAPTGAKREEDEWRGGKALAVVDDPASIQTLPSTSPPATPFFKEGKNHSSGRSPKLYPVSETEDHLHPTLPYLDRGLMPLQRFSDVGTRQGCKDKRLNGARKET